MINFLAESSSIGENVLKALSSMDLWTAVAKSIIIILIGFIFTKAKLFPENTGKVLTKLVMLVALPCLAFGSFMTKVTQATFNSALFAFVYGFIIYILFIFLSKVIFLWVKDPTRRKVLSILFVFGSTTFFGQPLISAVFGSTAYNDSNMFNVAYRVFLYSYAYVAICGDDKKSVEDTTEEAKSKKITWPVIASYLKKIFVNPIIIATFVGFILWSLQLIGDTSDASQWWVVTVNNSTGAFWNLSVSLPWLYQTIKTIGGLASPLVWIAIGCTLGKVSFKQAAADKTVWIYSFIKMLVGPLVNFGLLLLINLIPGINVTFSTVAATTLMWAVPPATVAVTYCINSDKEATLASSCSLIGTLVAVVFIPIYIVLLTVIQTVGYFA